MPSQTYAYPTAGDFMEIEQELLPGMQAASPAFRHFPDENHDAYYLEWTQGDNTTGMQQIRGINGEPPRVKPLGENRYHAEPGIYGEYTEIDEKMLITRRDVGRGADGRLMPTRSMIAERQVHLLKRRMTRKEWMIWQVMVYGYFTVLDIKGAVAHKDAYKQLQYTAGTPWSTAATAAPLANFRAVQLLGRGTSANFGAGATAYCNRTVANEMMANTNAADLGGKRTTGGGSITSLNGWNTILEGEGLPRVVVYDEGYIDEVTGAFTLYLPDDVLVVVGSRPGGVQPGAYMHTANANNTDRGPGPYTLVDDSADRNEVPRKIKVHDGHNGGVVLRFPGMIIRMNV